tara:strand:- start:8211 stop:9149 length:939 start_codon:yes stop_codon:yes gene_type:complete
MKTYVWTSDFRDNTGEGKLARLFFYKSKLKKNLKIKIICPECDYEFSKNQLRVIGKKRRVDYNSFFFKYFYPLIGCFFSWVCYFSGNKFIYINYLPLWNFLLFLLFAPHTRLGPITGSIRYELKNKRILIPFFYRISRIIIHLRYKSLIFATDNLKKYFKNSNKKIKYNFVLSYLKKKNLKTIKKSTDLVVYYRKHQNKNNIFLIKIVKWMLNNKVKVNCIGDKIKDNRVKNFGYLNNKNSINLIRRSKIGINSSENFYSFFMMDCINNSTKVLCDKNSLIYGTSLKNKVLLSDYRNFKQTCKLVYNFIKKK